MKEKHYLWTLFLVFITNTLSVSRVGGYLLLEPRRSESLLSFFSPFKYYVKINLNLFKLQQIGSGCRQLVFSYVLTSIKKKGLASSRRVYRSL